MNHELQIGTTRIIDELGRIVIPKKIRDNLCIKPQDALEIRVSGQTILLKKYEEMLSPISLCEEYLSIFAKSSSTAVAICSTQHVLAARGVSLSDKYPLSAPMKSLIAGCRSYQYQETNKIPLFDGSNTDLDCLYPIGTAKKPLGCVVLFHFREQTKEERACAKFVADMLTHILLKEDAYVA